MPSWTGSFDGAPAGLLGPQLVVAEQLHRLVGGRLVVARVVRQPGHRGERELLVLDPVASPDLHRVDAELDGELVHDALDGVRRLGPAGAAVGVGDRRVGEHAGALEAEGRELVDRVVHERAEQRHARSDQAEVGAHVGEQVHPQPEHGAVAVRGDRDVLDLVAAVVRDEQAVGAGLGVLDRLADALRREERQHLLGDQLQLAAEPAADVRRDDPDLLLRRTGQQRQQEAQDVRDLGGRPDGESAAATRRVDDDAARLHERRNQPLLHVAPLDDDLGARERLVGGPAGAGRARVEDPGVALVGALVRVHQLGAVGERRLHVEHDRQRLVVDVDRLERVDGGGLAARHHDRDRLADVADLVDRERRPVRHHDVLGDRPGARQRSLDVGDVPPVNTATTPGCERAAEASMRVMRACAIGLRRIAMCSMPGSTMLSVQLVRPVMSRASSLRRRGAPTSAGRSSVTVMPSPPRQPWHQRCDRRRECAWRPRRRRRLGRCSGSRCTGTGCPRCPRGSASSLGLGSSPSSDTAAMIMPGVQKPHCSAWRSWNACCTGCSSPSAARPSIVVTSCPSACTASTEQLLTLRPSNSTVQAPQLLVSQPTTVPTLPSVVAQIVDEQSAWFDVVVVANSVDSDADRRHQASRLTTDPTRERAGMSRRVRVGQRNAQQAQPGQTQQTHRCARHCHKRHCARRMLRDANSDGHVRACVKDNRVNGRCASVPDRYTAETKQRRGRGRTAGQTDLRGAESEYDRICDGKSTV